MAGTGNNQATGAKEGAGNGADTDTGKTVSVVVAQGRTLVDATGKSRGPGEKAKLLEADVAHMRAAGFLHDEDEKPVIVRGLTIKSSDGPSVRLA